VPPHVSSYDKVWRLLERQHSHGYISGAQVVVINPFVEFIYVVQPLYPLVPPACQF